MSRLELFVKRVFDLVISLVGCLLLIPIFFLVKICYVLVGDGKKILFRQERIGKDGKRIYIYKFRTMVHGADEILKNLMDTDPNILLEYSVNKKLKNDPRITKLGNILRKSSIDELPQMLNVLKGDLSVIGPRPYLVREREDMGDYYYDIIKVKPGITGLWQVSGRSNISFRDRCRIEAGYVSDRSLFLDVKIFFLTFWVVFKKDGAN